MHSTVLSLLHRFNLTKTLLQLSQKMQLQTTRRCLKTVAVHKIPLDVSIASMKRSLKSYNIPFDEGTTCLAIQCTICSKLNKNLEDCKIHINKTTGAFICACNYSGQWEDIKQSFDSKNMICKTARDKTMLADMEKLKSYLKETNKSTVIVNTLSVDVQNKILETFDFKGCTTLVFEVLDVRINSDHSTLYFPVRNVSTKTTVGYATITAANHTYTLQPQLSHLPQGGIVYARANSRAVRDGGAIIVGSVRDMVALLSAKVSGCVVVAPNGLTSLSQFVLPCFESFGKVTLWLGDDLTAWDAARIFARKLGEKRCLVVRSTSQQQIVRVPHMEAEQNYRAILQSAQPLWHKSITNFAALRDDVLSDLMNTDKVQGVKWQRFPALTRILKGHRRGELTVLTGPTGSGKTTFISEYSLDLAIQDVNTLWGSFEIRNARLARTMLQQFAGVKLDAHLDQFGEFADAFEQLPIYFMTFHGQQPVKVVMDAIEHAAYVHDIAHVIIDNVQFMLGMGGGGGGSGGANSDSWSNQMMGGDRFWRQDQVIAAFRTFATQRNCHVTLVIHPRKEREDERLTTASIFGGAKASQEADNVLILQDGRLSSLRGKKYLQIAKNRYSGDLGLMPLDFIKDKLSFAQKQSKEDKDKDTGTEQLEVSSPQKRTAKSSRFTKTAPRSRSSDFDDSDGYGSSDGD